MEKWLSICIPTRDRAVIVKQLLDSIYSQSVDMSQFEVCISDNSDNDDTKIIVEDKMKEYSNLYYQKSSSKGFLNSVEALKMGNGKYLKLHNDYSILHKDSIQNIISIIQKASLEDAYIYFSMGILKRKNTIKCFNSYDKFANYISYFATWSSSFGIWKKDFDIIMENGIEPNYMFPHTSFLHKIVNENKYIVDNNEYAFSIIPEKKGGYNLVDNFVRIYLSMVRDELLGSHYISSRTYRKIEKGILLFCAKWYWLIKHEPERYTFSFDDEYKIIKMTCKSKGVLLYSIYKVAEMFLVDIKQRLK